MKGFTLTELIVVVAIMAVAAMLGTRYYYTDIDMYRFQNALTEFKSAVNLARARSLTGVIVNTESAGAKRVNKPLSINIEKIVINTSYQDTGSSILLTPTPNQDLTVVRIPTGTRIEVLNNPSYVTLSGFCPNGESQAKLLAKNISFPYWINGPLWMVTYIGSGSSLSLKLTQSSSSPTPNLNGNPTFNDPISLTLNPSTTVSTAYIHVKSVIQIISCSKTEYPTSEGHYAKVYESESGPSLDFKFDSSKIRMGFSLANESKPCDSVLPEIIGKYPIMFDKGLMVGGMTYCVSFSPRSGTADSTVKFTILPTGILTQP